MLRQISASCGVFFILAGTGAHAQQVTGGSIELSYSAFNDDTDVNRTSLEGSIELGFNRNIAMQFDLGFHGFGAIDDNSTNFTVHGIYHANDRVSLGLFAGVEDFVGESESFLGLEAGVEASKFGGEIYLADFDVGTESVQLYGLHTELEVSESVSIGLDYDRIDDDFVTFDSLKLSADYSFGQGAAAFAEIGSGEVGIGDLSASEAFFGLGLRFNFGADRGATFDRRSLGGVFPGL